jgi:hypothetical protein
LGGSLGDGFQDISRLGDMREVNLWLELVGRRRSSRATAAAGLTLRKVLLNALRLILFDGTGVRFLFGYADLGENVENRLALDL